MILNGRDALTAGKNDYSSEDEVDNQGPVFQNKSDRSENMKFFLQSKIMVDNIHKIIFRQINNL